MKGKKDDKILLMPPNAKSSPDPYNFILAPPPKKAGFSLGNSSKKQLIVLGLGAVLIVGVSIFIASTLLGQGAKAHNQKLTELAQAQTELIRLSTIGSAKATNLETRSLAVNTQLSVESSLQSTRAALQKRKIKVDNKTLAGGRNTKSDQLLAQATSNNNFDAAFKELINSKLINYQKLLQSAYDSGNKAEKKAFEASFKNVALLIPKNS